MDLTLAVGYLGLTILFVVASALAMRANTRFARALAEQHALVRFLPTSDPGRLSASVGGLSIKLEKGAEGLEVQVSGVRRGVMLRHRTVTLSPGSRRAARPLPEVEDPFELGAPDFDQTFTTGGAAISALALFGAAERRLLLDLAREGFVVVHVSEGELFALLRGDLSDPAEVARRLSSILPRLTALEPRADLMPLMLEHVRADPVPGFRERCLVELLNQADPSARAAAISIARGSGHPPMELAAAVATADASAARSALTRGGAGSGLISGALGALACDPSSAEARCALGLELLRAASPAVQAAGARLIAETGAPGDTEAEEALLTASEGADPLSLPVIAEALARVGTVRSVPSLHALERASLDGFTRGRLEQARLAIQARAQGAEAGALTLSGVAPKAGALSVSTEAGAVAMAGSDR